MKKSDRTGLQHSGKTEESTCEINDKHITDGGLLRRQFLNVLGSLVLLAGVSRSEATEDFEPSTERAHGSSSADCGSVTTPAPVAEMFAIPDGGEVRIKRPRAEDTDEHSVQMDIYTGSNESRISLKRIFLSEEAWNIARRLNPATDMIAVGIEGRR